MILHLGCGEAPRHEGTLNVDIRDLPNIDVVADVRKLPFKDEEHTGIISRNLIEHLGREEIDPMLKEWSRVLMPGSRVLVETVDVGELMNNWQGIPWENVLDGLYGQQTYDENFHKMGFTQKTLGEALERAGFAVSKIESFTHREIPRMIVHGQKL